MSDDLEPRLRARFKAALLPAAPEALRAQLEGFGGEGHAASRRRSRLLLVLLLPVVAVLIAAGLLTVGSGLPPAPGSSVRPETPGANVSPPPASTSSPFPSVVDGLPVLSVSDVLALREAGGLKNQRIALGGYWSDGSVMHSCAPPLEPVGDLEIYCTDGERGITERNEPIMVIDVYGQSTAAFGPHLTPSIPNELAGPLFTLPLINGQRYPPVPIVVIGHFDDPRVQDCRKEARRLCADRLVVEAIPVFDPGSVPPPPPSPSPSPFPSPAPSGLFGPDPCAGDVPYSFVGWTRTDELKLSFSRPGHVWAMVTADPVAIGEWSEDPSRAGHRFRWYGRRICIGEESQVGAIEYSWVPGSTYQLWDDGRRTPGTP